jgi:hypothetical protein
MLCSIKLRLADNSDASFPRTSHSLELFYGEQRKGSEPKLGAFVFGAAFAAKGRY